MKKILIIGLVICFFISYSPNIGDAQKLKHSYSTGEDVLLEMLKPEIEKILKDKHKNLFTWNYEAEGGLIDLEYVHDLSTPKWYNVTLSVEYKISDNKTKPKNGKSLIRLKITPASFSQNDSASNKIEVVDIQDAQEID